MKEILKLGGILLLITAVCAGLLGLVNSVTSPLIAESKIAATNQAIQKLLPEADTVTDMKIDQTGFIKELYKATHAGTYIGAVAKVAPNGYGGAIEILVGVDSNEKITGIEVLTHAETPGLGANLTNESFVTQFVGKVGGINVQKSDASGNDIAAITGATITSQAVADGVNEAVTYILGQQDTMKEGN